MITKNFLKRGVGQGGTTNSLSPANTKDKKLLEDLK